MGLERKAATARLAGMTLAIASIVGCGQVRDVIHSPPYDGGDGRSSGGTTSFDDGGGGAIGSGGFGGNASIGGDGGPPAETGGSSIGAGGGSSGSGGVTETGAGPNAGGEGGVVGVLDPHREERTELVADYCALLEKYPCRAFSSRQGLIPASAPLEEKRRICEQESQALAYQNTVNGCYEEWATAMRCNATIAFTCPCAALGCQLPNDATGFDATTGSIPQGACFDERTAYSTCLEERNAPDAWQTPIVGSRAKVHWRTTDSGAGCHAEGVREGLNGLFVAKCEGAPGGPFRCDCMLNSRPLEDLVNTRAAAFSATDCRDVAQTMADGACVNVLDCCVAWKNDSIEGQPPYDDCGCTSDPTRNIFGPSGFSSCQELADSYDGSVVSTCPQYR